MWWGWTAAALAVEPPWPARFPEVSASRAAPEWEAWPDGLALPVPLRTARVRVHLGEADQLAGVLERGWCTAELREWPLAGWGYDGGRPTLAVTPLDGPCLLGDSPFALGRELTGTLASPYAFAEATLPPRTKFTAVRRDGAWHLRAAERAGDLPSPVTVAGVPLDLRTRLSVSAGGLAGTLAAPHAFAEATLPAGADLVAERGDDGWHLRSARLAADAPVPVQVGDLSMDLRTATVWTGARRLESGALAAPAEVGGLPLDAGPIGWDESEQLKAGTLAAELTRGGLVLPAGAAFDGRLDGSPRWTAPDGAPIRFRGLRLATVASCDACAPPQLEGTLAEASAWEGLSLAAGTAVGLFDGVLSAGTLAAAGSVRGVVLPAGTTLSLGADALRGVPTAPVSVGALVAAAGEALDLDAEGRPLALVLGAPATVGGLRLPAGARLMRADGARGWSAGVTLRPGEHLGFGRFEAGEPLPEWLEHRGEGPGWLVSHSVDMAHGFSLGHLAWAPDGGDIERI